MLRRFASALAPLFLLLATGCYTPPDQPDPPRGDRDDREVARVYNRHVGAAKNPEPKIANVRVNVTSYTLDAAEYALLEPAWNEVGFGVQETLASNGLRIGVGGNRFSELLAAALKQAKSAKRNDSWLTIADGQRTTYGITPAIDVVAFTYQDAGAVQKKHDLQKARLRLELAPELLPARNVRLKLSPSILHLDQVDKSLRLPDLQVRLTAADGEAIVIGPTPDASGKLGGAFLGAGAAPTRTLILLKPQSF